MRRLLCNSSIRRVRDEFAKMPVIALDLDGTLIDCRERQSLLAASLCRAAGFELNLERFWSTKREGATTALALCSQGADTRFAERISRLWTSQIEGNAWLQMDRVLSDAMSALQDALKFGHKLHLVTARSQKHALHAQLRWLALQSLFDHVEVVSPQAAALNKAKYLMSSRPMAYIGDSESDAEAALAAKVRFLAVSCGQRSSGFLKNRVSLHAEDIKSNLQEAIKEIINAEN